MRINRITYNNFKGLRDFTLDLGGHDHTVFGINGAGKSTLYDGFLWALWGKDSHGQANFQVKTIDPETGEPHHELDHSVEVEFDNGLTLKRVLREKWVRKRGSAYKEMTGHETEYLVNDVPGTKAAYDAAIAELGSEGDMRVLSDPLHFNTGLSWQERRDILLGLVDDLSDEEVAASDDDLAEVPALIAEHGLDGYRAIARAKRQEHKKALDAVQGRISEASRAAPMGAPDTAKIEARIAEIERAQAKSKKDLEAALRKAEKLRKASAKANQEYSLAREAHTAERSRLTTLLAGAERRMKEALDEGNRLKDGTCPTCGQAVEHDQKHLPELRAKYDRAKAEVADLKTRLAALPAPDNSAVLAADKAYNAARLAARPANDATLDMELRQATTELQRAKAAADAQERVKALKAEEKKIAAQYEQADHHLVLLDSFELARAKLLEGKINAKFRLARWKLYEDQLNGGIKPAAEVMVDGVPFTNLNTGSRLAVGIDIINTLAEHRGFAPPVWLDNAESIVDIPPTKGQFIALVVSESDPVLRVEPHRELVAA